MSQEINDANFEKVIQSNKVVVVDFWGPWCGPCRTIAPMIEELTNEFQGRAIVGKLNVDSSPAITAKFGIRNIPTILIFQKGVLVAQLPGIPNKSALIAKINSYL